MQMNWTVIHLSAVYPGGSVGWIVSCYRLPVGLDEALAGPLAMDVMSDLYDYAVGYYHQQVGPAYSLDDFTLTLWSFEDSQEMFYGCGIRLLETDGKVSNIQRPNVVG